ncbi:hemerythrin domain-containing protein [Chrysiogenes arsenatis]|uniref:hemerythrin domain-containing protein n=1 Tax=Chrysiogenes arsenatis TaxID=309797 RepID=UPI00047F1BCF|nr:hemerythrin domain-containing protein [Chrysiogenes arsenatis]
MTLVDELKHDHQQLFRMMDEVKKVGIGNAEGRKMLLNAKRSLLQHLSQEDRRLYPVLQKAAQSDPRVKRLYDSFASEMSEISRQALQFFDRDWEQQGGLDFARDFGRLYATLHQRMHREETILYAEFQKIA